MAKFIVDIEKTANPYQVTGTVLEQNIDDEGYQVIEIVSSDEEDVVLDAIRLAIQRAI